MAALTPRFIVALGMVVLVLSVACVSSTSKESEGSVEPTATVEVSPEIAILAHRLVFAYMSDKPWGFFGATCEQWIKDDYLWDKSTSELHGDGRIKITYQRHEDRILGPEQLDFFVNIDTQQVEGDNKPENEAGRMGVAEGCDQW